MLVRFVRRVTYPSSDNVAGRRRSWRQFELRSSEHFPRISVLVLSPTFCASLLGFVSLPSLCCSQLAMVLRDVPPSTVS